MRFASSVARFTVAGLLKAALEAVIVVSRAKAMSFVGGPWGWRDRCRLLLQERGDSRCSRLRGSSVVWELFNCHPLLWRRKLLLLLVVPGNPGSVSKVDWNSGGVLCK